MKHDIDTSTPSTFEQIRSQIENATNFATIRTGSWPALERYNPQVTLDTGPKDATYGYTVTKSGLPDAAQCQEGILYDVITFSYGRVGELGPESDFPPPRDWCDKLDLHILLKHSNEVLFLNPQKHDQAINVSDVVVRDLQLATFLNTTPLKPVEPITR